MQDNLKTKFEKCCEAYIKAFEKKHDVYLEFWVGVGDVASIGDRFFNFADIRYDIDNDVKVGEIEEWDDYCTILAELALPRKINFESWVKGAPKPYDEDKIAEFRKSHDEVEEARKRLEDAINKDREQGGI